MSANLETPRRVGICFVGLMVGRHRGYLTSQGLVVSDLLSRTGEYDVAITSTERNRYARLVDILVTVIRTRRRTDIQCLEVYGGPSFVIEDMASALAQLFGQRIVMVLHGGALPDFMARYPRWTRRVLSRADVLVTPSTYLQRAIGAHGFSARVIPNVVELDAYPFRERRQLKPRLFWMRSFHHVWNAEMAVRVLSKIRQRVPDATIVLAGQDKGSLANVQKLAADLGVAQAASFPGFLDHDAKIRHGEAADIFLNTNRIDNMPVAVVEACAMGLPVISTDVGGIPDLLAHGDTGILVPDDDDDAMTDAVLRLLSDEGLAGRLSRNGRRLAEQSAWARVRPMWDGLFSELCQRAPLASLKQVH
jgi:glycosyltransferase involved in cell wall biosynthesis